MRQNGAKVTACATFSMPIGIFGPKIEIILVQKNGTFYTIFRFVSYDFHIFKKFSGMNIIY